MQSKIIKDYDLHVDLTKRAADLLAAAKFYFTLADQQDAISGLNDDFEIVDTGTSRDLIHNAELTGFPYTLGGRAYNDVWPWSQW